jgi:uncharacterized protein
LQPFFIGSLEHSTKYEIQFSGLKLGEYRLEWDIEPLFFKSFGNEEILESELHTTVNLEKKERLMTLIFQITGKVKTLCDRCGDEVWTDTETDNELIVRFGTETDFSNDEVIFLDNSEYKLDVAQFIYEFGLLAVPQKRIHQEGDCNPDLEDFLNEKTESEEEIDNNDYIDPRWEALKKLK